MKNSQQPLRYVQSLTLTALPRATCNRALLSVSPFTKFTLAQTLALRASITLSSFTNISYLLGSGTFLFLLSHLNRMRMWALGIYFSFSRVWLVVPVALHPPSLPGWTDGWWGGEAQLQSRWGTGRTLSALHSAIRTQWSVIKTGKSCELQAFWLAGSSTRLLTLQPW